VAVRPGAFALVWRHPGTAWTTVHRSVSLLVLVLPDR